MQISSIAIVGAGALGCYFGAKLSEAGLAVTVIDVDAPRIALIAAEGIQVRDDDGERIVPVAAALAKDCAGPVDLVMLFTKGMHSAAAMRSVAHLAAPETLAVTLQNGIGNAEIMAEIFPPANVLDGMTGVPGDLVGPNSVSSSGNWDTALGAHLPEGADRVAPVAAALRKAGFLVDTDSNVQTRIWDKLCFNTAMNAVSAITGKTNGGMDSEAGRRLLAAVADETLAVATALGVTVDAAHVHGKISSALVDHQAHRTSMLQDLGAGRRTEIESINGAVARIGARAGVPTPINATLADLVRMIDA